MVKYNFTLSINIIKLLLFMFIFYGCSLEEVPSNIKMDSKQFNFIIKAVRFYNYTIPESLERKSKISLLIEFISDLDKNDTIIFPIQWYEDNYSPEIIIEFRNKEEFIKRKAIISSKHTSKYRYREIEANSRVSTELIFEYPSGSSLNRIKEKYDLLFNYENISISAKGILMSDTNACFSNIFFNEVPIEFYLNDKIIDISDSIKMNEYGPTVDF